MKQEDKEILLKDICARLPYKVKCSFGVDDAIYEITGINPSACGASEIQATHVKSSINGDFKLNSCKPYLFPLSSMTDEQKEEYRKVGELDTEILSKHPMDGTPFPALYNSQDWLDAHHFDYRGLIEKGLAIDATNLNIY